MHALIQIMRNISRDEDMRDDLLRTNLVINRFFV